MSLLLIIKMTAFG